MTDISHVIWDIILLNLDKYNLTLLAQYGSPTMFKYMHSYFIPLKQFFLKYCSIVFPGVQALESFEIYRHVNHIRLDAVWFFCTSILHLV